MLSPLSWGTQMALDVDARASRGASVHSAGNASTGASAMGAAAAGPSVSRVLARTATGSEATGGGSADRDSGWVWSRRRMVPRRAKDETANFERPLGRLLAAAGMRPPPPLEGASADPAPRRASAPQAPRPSRTLADAVAYVPHCVGSLPDASDADAAESNRLVLASPVPDWAALPPGIDPTDGHLPASRAPRKRQQLDNILAVMATVVRDGDTVVDLCGASGHLGFPIAHAFPACKVVIIDMKPRAIAIAHERLAMCKLPNVRIIQGMIQDFTEPFDVGVALHACGAATDLGLALCRKWRAAFVMCPCCVGKVKHSSLEYPRSEEMRSVLSPAEFELLAMAADFAHGKADGAGGAPVGFVSAADSDGAVTSGATASGEDASSATSASAPVTKPARAARLRRQCKTFMEADRNMCQREAGYVTRLMVLDPPSASPKNDIIAGVHTDRLGDVSVVARGEGAVALWR